MGVVLYPFLSGDSLYLGLFLVFAGVAAARWYAKLGRSLVLVGLVLAGISAGPIHPAAFASLLVLGTVWHAGRTRRPAVGAFLMAAVVVVFVWAVRQRGASRLTLPRDRAVFVIGDSLSAGLGSSREGVWPQLLSRRLGLEVTNLAMAGATLRDGVSQARRIPEGGVVILVELGGNDILGGATRESFRADLRSLLAAVAGKDRRILMFELPLLPFQGAFGRIQRDVCAQYGVVLISRSLLAGAVALPGHADDGLHLSPRGHSWLAERVGEMWGKG